MKKNHLLYSILILSVIILTGCGSSVASDNREALKTSSNISGEMSKAEKSADKIEVIHFHATQQCWSCITVGEYALKTIKEKFPKEYANGTIVFKDINGELPQNRDMVIKYQAGGSSLFINTIVGGKESIEEDITVWRLIGSETKFVNYFENKLKNKLGK